MSRIGKLPVAVPSGVSVYARRRNGRRSRVLRASCVSRFSRRSSTSKLDRRRRYGRPQGRCKEPSQRARIDPHAHRQHGRRREQGLSQEPRDSRRRLSRRKVGRKSELDARLFASRRLRSAQGHRVVGRGTRIAFTSTESTNKPSGQVAAEIRGLRPPEPYKGKGHSLRGRGRSQETR